MPKNTTTTHPLARLVDEYARASAEDRKAAEADKQRVAAARARIDELQRDGEARKKRRIELSRAYAEGNATAAELEKALAAEQRHADTLRAAREGLHAVEKAGSGAEARLERKRADAVERMAPMYREAVESKLAALTDELRAETERFLAPVEAADPALARALAQTLPGLGGVAARVESALAAAEAAAQRSGPRQFSPGEHGEELPVQERSPADVLREVAERRTDVTGRRAPVGIVAGRTMQ